MILLRPLLLALFISIALSPHASAQESGGSSRYFEVEQVNPGLGQPPRGLNLDTPQAAMETFLFAARSGDWDLAARALDLSPVPPEDQAETGPELARRLHQVVERGMWLDWGALPDRPDALEANASSENPMAGEPRRSIRLSILDIGDRPVSIRMSRLKPADGDPVWVFSDQTVGNINAMYEVFGPTRLERMLPEFLQKKAFWTLAWWEVIALPLVLVFALLAALLTYRIAGTVKRRQPSRLASNILDVIRLPLALLAFVAVFTATRSLLFTFSGAINMFLTPLQTTLFVIALVLVGVRVVDAILDRFVRNQVEEIGGSESREERDLYTNISAARRLAIVLAFIIGGALVLLQVNAFQTLGFSLLASAGVIGLILAFAARSVLANIMSSLQIAMAKTARIGDAVLYDGNWCYVEKINFTYIQLQSWDNRRLMVPVNEFVTTTFENWSKQDSSLIKPVELRLDHRADVDRLREAFGGFVENDDDVINKEDSKVQVIDQDATGMVVRFYVSAEDPSTAWNMHCRLREEMMNVAVRLEAEQGGEPADRPSYLPREREVKLSDLAAAE